VIASILWVGDALFISKFKILLQEVVPDVWVKLYPCRVNSRNFLPDPMGLGPIACELARNMMVGRIKILGGAGYDQSQDIFSAL